jgi:hypothetical protein
MKESRKCIKSSLSESMNSVNERIHSANPSQMMYLQRTIGNKAVEQLVKSRTQENPAAFRKPQEISSNSNSLAGNGGQLIQRYIETETTSVNATAYDGVQELEAVIGSSLHWSRGTNPEKGVPTRIKHVGPIKGRYVGGHMLNQEWGGLGNYSNMIVLSISANGSHRAVDGVIRNLGNIAGRLELYRISDHNGDGINYEYGVEEKIVVDDPAPDGTENYPAEAKIPSGFTVSLRPVKREKDSNDDFEDWTEQAAYNRDYTVANVPPYPADATNKRRNGIQKQKKIVSTKGMNPTAMKVKDFMKIKGIGKTSALSLKQAFRTYSTETTLTMSQHIQNGTMIGQDLMGMGVTRTMLSLVHYRK